jgi:hypothetical protein
MARQNDSDLYEGAKYLTKQAIDQDLTQKAILDEQKRV